MATNFIYTNFSDQPITEQQVENIRAFNKIFKINNVIKKIESFKDKLLYEVTYYKDKNESISEINSIYQGLQFLQIREKKTEKSFIIEDIKHFNQNQLLYSSRELFDQNNNLICVEIIDDNGLPVFNETEKDLYHQNEKILSFCYNENGSIKYIWGDLVEGTDQRQKGSISADMINIYFPNLLLENPYYTTANFLP